MLAEGYVHGVDQRMATAGGTAVFRKGIELGAPLRLQGVERGICDGLIRFRKDEDLASKPPAQTDCQGFAPNGLFDCNDIVDRKSDSAVWPFPVR